MKNCGRSSWEWGCALAYPYGIYRSAVGEERTQEKVGAGALHVSVILTWSRSSIPLQQGESQGSGSGADTSGMELAVPRAMGQVGMVLDSCPGDVPIAPAVSPPRLLLFSPGWRGILPFLPPLRKSRISHQQQQE